MTNQSFQKLDHHAYLSIDEPSDFARLFDRGVARFTFDLRGRTTIEGLKNKLKLGVTKLSHMYLDVRKDNLAVNSKEELQALLDDYKSMGVRNLYAVRLVVEWPSGDMQEWKRRSIKVKDKEVERDSKSGRFNTLLIPYPTYEGIARLQKIYGSDIVNATICPEVEVITAKKIICVGTLPK